MPRPSPKPRPHGPCDTTKCTNYYLRLRGISGQSQPIRFSLMDDARTLIPWEFFVNPSHSFNFKTWFSVSYNFSWAESTEVARLNVYDCHDRILSSQSFVMPAGTSWKKWVIIGDFGSTCFWGIIPHSSGTGDMPDTPPPVY